MEKIRKGDNVVKKHQRPNPMLQREGGIVEKVMPIHVSNVALFNTKTQKADRVAIKEVDGKKVRVFKSNGEVVA
jgi:large subunit ribosomal protein L24